MQENKPTVNLEENKTFCLFPWTHIHVTPRGRVFPCCNTGYSDYIGDYKNETLIELMNSEEMKKLRLNMLNNVPSKICNSCYEQEKISGHSGRTYSLDLFKKDLDSYVEKTQSDGTLTDFQMKYFDIRFSNICNMKCRTCSPEFSSQWSQEYHNENKSWPIMFHANDNQPMLLNQVLEHIDHIDTFYFAGGEPLITEEHYILLEKLIQKNLTNVRLFYNSNLSTLKYKDKDILSLWSNFNNITMVASIDHVKERAEYIRNGTDWATVETNLIKISRLPNIHFAINTVLSIFNYTTLDEFYTHLINIGVYTSRSQRWNLFNAFNPPYYMAQILPRNIKNSAKPKLEKLIEFKKRIQRHETCIKMVTDAINFVESADLWEKQKENFLANVVNRDKIRGEDFLKTFPELAEMMNS